MHCNCNFLSMSWHQSWQTNKPEPLLVQITQSMWSSGHRSARAASVSCVFLHLTFKGWQDLVQHPGRNEVRSPVSSQAAATFASWMDLQIRRRDIQQKNQVEHLLLLNASGERHHLRFDKLRSLRKHKLSIGLWIGGLKPAYTNWFCNSDVSTGLCSLHECFVAMLEMQLVTLLSGSYAWHWVSLVWLRYAEIHAEMTSAYHTVHCCYWSSTHTNRQTLSI